MGDLSDGASVEFISHILENAAGKSLLLLDVVRQIEERLLLIGDLAAGVLDLHHDILDGLLHSVEKLCYLVSGEACIVSVQQRIIERPASGGYGCALFLQVHKALKIGMEILVVSVLSCTEPLVLTGVCGFADVRDKLRRNEHFVLVVFFPHADQRLLFVRGFGNPFKDFQKLADFLARCHFMHYGREIGKLLRSLLSSLLAHHCFEVVLQNGGNVTDHGEFSVYLQKSVVCMKLFFGHEVSL